MTITTAEPSAIDYVRARAAEILELDRWPRERLLELQRSRLRSMLQHAVDHSPYYRETLGADAADRELSELPALSKQVVTERFDELVTDPRVRLASVRRFLETAEPGVPLLGEFRAFATSGATGSPGVSVYSRAEFTEWVAAGLARLARVGIGPDTRLIAIGAPGDVHITRQLFAAFQSGSDGVPRLSVTTPLREAVAALNRYRPDAVIGYASVLGTLADEQLEGRLAIEPRLTIATSEVLTDETARRVEAAWGSQPFNVYAATEAPGIASGSPERVGMHVWEESVVVEGVDAGGRPVRPGVPGAKVLLTSLVSRVQPLIRTSSPIRSWLPQGRIRVVVRFSDWPASTGGAMTSSCSPPRRAAPSRCIRTGCERRSRRSSRSGSTRSCMRATGCSACGSCLGPRRV
jgi:phenylacetate-coenzyme A ligase PaaK-like adenylate-forming protein